MHILTNAEECSLQSKLTNNILFTNTHTYTHNGHRNVEM